MKFEMSEPSNEVPDVPMNNNSFFAIVGQLEQLEALLREGQLEAAKSLMESMSVEQLSMSTHVFGDPPLILAVSMHQHEIVDYLIQRGVNPHQLGPLHCNLLMVAVRAGSLETVEKALKLGVDPNETDSVSGLCVCVCLCVWRLVMRY